MTPQEVGGQLNVSRETLEQLSRFVALLERWQRSINLVSARSLTDVWRRHILDSGQLANYIPANARTILDVGSGGGFPGLVLSIIGPWEVRLVESDQRKAVFLQTVINELGLLAKVCNSRIEALSPCYPDVISARALAPIPKLMNLIAPQLHSKVTCLLLKGAAVKEELTGFQNHSNMIPSFHPSLSSSDGVVVSLTMPD